MVLVTCTTHKEDWLTQSSLYERFLHVHEQVVEVARTTNNLC